MLPAISATLSVRYSATNTTHGEHDSRAPAAQREALRGGQGLRIHVVNDQRIHTHQRAGVGGKVGEGEMGDVDRVAARLGEAGEVGQSDRIGAQHANQRRLAREGPYGRRQRRDLCACSDSYLQFAHVRVYKGVHGVPFPGTVRQHGVRGIAHRCRGLCRHRDLDLGFDVLAVVRHGDVHGHPARQLVDAVIARLRLDGQLALGVLL